MSEENRSEIAAGDRLAEVVVGQVNEWLDIRVNSYDPGWITNYNHYLTQYDSTERWFKGEGYAGRSKIFIGLTRRKIYTVYNRAAKILFGDDEYPYTISPSPDIELMPGEDPQYYKDAAGRMRIKLDDQFLPCNMNWPLKTRFGVLGAIIFGSSVFKFPIIKRKNVTRYRRPEMPSIFGQNNQTMMNQPFMEPRLVSKEYDYPDIEVCNLFDIAFDPMCDPHNPNPLQTGRGVAQYKVIGRGELQRMALNPSYKIDAIKELLVLPEQEYNDPSKADIKMAAGLSGYTPEKGYKIMEFWGLIEAGILREYGVEVPDIYGKEDEIEAMAVFSEPPAGGVHTIKAALNPFEPTRRPYHLLRYENNLHSVYGRGIAENIKGEQKILNSAMRLFIDTKVMAAMPPVALDVNMLLGGGAIDKIDMYPGKVFKINGPADKFFKSMTTEDASSKLLEFFAVIEKYADEISGITKYTQGTDAEHLNKTASGMAMLMELADQTIYGFIDNVDTQFIEPMVESAYHFNMQFDEDPRIKGDYEVKAGGKMSLIRSQTYWQKVLQFLNSTGGNLPPPVLLKLFDQMQQSMGIKDMEGFYEEAMQYVAQSQPNGAQGANNAAPSVGGMGGAGGGVRGGASGP